MAVNAPHDASDYVYSTWDDNKLRAYLEEKNIIKTKTQLKREEVSLLEFALKSVSKPTRADPFLFSLLICLP